MKKNLLTPLIIICSVLIFSCQKSIREVSMEGFQLANKKEDRSFIVIAKEGQNLKTIADELSAIGARKFKIKEALDELGLITVVTPDPSFPSKARRLAGVESVVVNLTMNFRLPEKVMVSKIKRQQTAASAKLVTDPYSVLQWGLKSVKAPQAWQEGYMGENAVVAVLDGGFFLNDPELAPNIIGSHSFIDGEEVQFKGNGFSHGTHVAGTIAAVNDAYGVVGVAPKAKLLLVKVLADSGSGSFTSLIDGIFYATNHKADVINMSLGGYLPTHSFIDDNGTPNDPSDDYEVEYTRDLKDLVKAMNRATLYAKLRGTLLIAAAGNDAINLSRLPDYNIYPAQCIGVLPIAANGPLGWGYNQDTSLHVPSYAFTNYGASVIKFGAPGGNIDPNAPFDETVVNVYGIGGLAGYFNFVFNTGYYEDGYFYYVWAAGTSMAAPHASAVAALIYGKHRGNISPWLAQYIMEQSAHDYGAPGNDKYFGYGQVNAAKAVKY